MLTTFLAAIGTAVLWLIWHLVGDASGEAVALLFRRPHAALVRILAESGARLSVPLVAVGLAALGGGLWVFLRAVNADPVSPAGGVRAGWGLAVAAVALGLLLWVAEAWRGSRRVADPAAARR